MSFRLEIVATNSYPGLAVGPIDGIPSDVPSIWADHSDGEYWWIVHHDGNSFRPIELIVGSRHEAIGVACDHAESMRVPVILIEQQQPDPATLPPILIEAYVA